MITVDITGIQNGNYNHFYGNVTSEGSSPVTARGFVLGVSGTPTLEADTIITVTGGGLGEYDINTTTYWNGSWSGRAYATNSEGTGYGSSHSFSHTPCLAEGTLILLADGTLKKIEDVEYKDQIMVWNFDEARLDSANPLWIKKPQQADRYNLLVFSDGSTLKTISQHRIFNKEMGMFTYPMTEDTPVGTTAFNSSGKEVTLVRKSIINEQVTYYNIITNRHINLFADGILTSCRYNNIYPIVEMKFVKDGRAPVGHAQYGVNPEYFEGLRLAEQRIPAADTIAYIKRLEVLRQQPRQTAPADTAVPCGVLEIRI